MSYDPALCFDQRAERSVSRVVGFTSKMRLSTLESLVPLDSWALGPELLSNSDQKINAKEAICVFAQI